MFREFVARIKMQERESESERGETAVCLCALPDKLGDCSNGEPLLLGFRSASSSSDGLSHRFRLRNPPNFFDPIPCQPCPKTLPINANRRCRSSFSPPCAEVLESDVLLLADGRGNEWFSGAWRRLSRDFAAAFGEFRWNYRNAAPSRGVRGESGTKQGSFRIEEGSFGPECLVSWGWRLDLVGSRALGGEIGAGSENFACVRRCLLLLQAAALLISGRLGAGAAKETGRGFRVVIETKRCTAHHC